MPAHVSWMSPQQSVVHLDMSQMLWSGSVVSALFIAVMYLMLSMPLYTFSPFYPHLFFAVYKVLIIVEISFSFYCPVVHREIELPCTNKGLMNNYYEIGCWFGCFMNITIMRLT